MEGNMDIDRINKIKNAIPKRMFFDPIFEKNGLEHQILADIKLDESKLEFNNILNCSALLNRQQEYHLFRKYNYFKYRLLKLTVGFEKSNEQIAPRPSPPVKLERLKEKSLSKIEKIIKNINELRNLLLKSNMRLIVKQVSKHAPDDSFKRDEFLSNAYMHIITSIECFDYRRGFKFSTYCVNVLISNLKRDASQLYKLQTPLENSDSINVAEAKEEDLSELNVKYNKEIIQNIFEEIRKSLNKPEEKIQVLSDYFGLKGDRLLLRDIAKKLGISKERVRQIKLQTIKAMQRKDFCYDPLI